MLYTANILSIFGMVKFEILVAIYFTSNLLLLIFNRNKVTCFFGGIFCSYYSWKLMEKMLIVILLAVFAATFWIAVNSTPYNWDSMTYHLARIVNWEQNRSVNFYATNIVRQTASPVFGAYVNLFVYILSGKNEVFLNLLQYFSFGTNAILIYAIARRLRVRREFSLLGVLLFTSMPIAFAEATTTQVDHLATVWLLSFIYLMLSLVEEDRRLEWNADTIKKVCYAALLIALGYLTKPSVCFGILFFLLWLLIVCIKRRDKLKTILKLSGIALPICIFPVIPELIRNMAAFGSIAHSSVGQRQLVGTLKPNYLFVNFLKNFSFNFVSDKIVGSDAFIIKLLNKASELMKVTLNDPSISEDGRPFEFPALPAMNCDSAINTFIIFMLVICTVWFLIRIDRQQRIQVQYSFYVLITFLVFCVFLRWEMFINRYMLSYFAIICPFITVQLQSLMEMVRRKGFVWGMLGIVLAACMMNFVREVKYIRELAPFEKPSGYFVYNRELEEDYSIAARYIKEHGFHKVGLYIGGNSYEYPLWQMLGEEVERIEHVNVDNELQRYEDREFLPNCIIAVDTSVFDKEEFKCHGATYKIVELGMENVRLLEREN